MAFKILSRRNQVNTKESENKPRKGLVSIVVVNRTGKQNGRKSAPVVPIVDSAGGTFCSTIPRNKQSRLISDRSNMSDDTWKSCASTSYHNHSPLLPAHRSFVDKDTKPADEVRELGMIMARCRNLPGNWYYSNNIILVNNVRCVRNIPSLSRDIELDSIAQEHAKAMAKSGQVQHSDPTALRFKFSGPCRRIGENVAVGSSIKDIHEEMIARHTADKNNILDRRYTRMGVGTCKGEDGRLFLCQIFKG